MFEVQNPVGGSRPWAFQSVWESKKQAVQNLDVVFLPPVRSNHPDHAKTREGTFS